MFSLSESTLAEILGKTSAKCPTSYISSEASMGENRFLDETCAQCIPTLLPLLNYANTLKYLEKNMHSEHNT